MINFEKAGDIYVTYTAADGCTWNYSKSDANPRGGTESIVYKLRADASETEEFFEIRLTRENDKVLVHCSVLFVENVLVEPILEDGMWTIDIVDSEKHVEIQVENLAEND
jgi:predicted RNA-binding protein